MYERFRVLIRVLGSWRDEKNLSNEISEHKNQANTPQLHLNDEIVFVPNLGNRAWKPTLVPSQTQSYLQLQTVVVYLREVIFCASKVDTQKIMHSQINLQK